ncbi:hypothetical protein LCY76_04160 [Fictibacillus sp. KIGAM418]|uniref:Uncharacterized protein n=1 Tax=Fictibacillus marinisediminis TaxID=2878389 RepID=A0A9X1X920_9BACL|nr:hypothetical protein [Fictibacillus marinisediminis]MCK6255796.1 hypothetical protein [Fictibacillus marinisediminis]
MRQAESFDDILEFSKTYTSQGTMYLSQKETSPGGILFSDEDSGKQPLELEIKLLLNTKDDSIYFFKRYMEEEEEEFEQTMNQLEELKNQFSIKTVNSSEFDSILSKK